MAEQDLMPRAAVADRYGVTVRTLERWARAGIGPKPIKLGPRVIRYYRAEVEAWPARGRRLEQPA